MPKPSMPEPSDRLSAIHRRSVLRAIGAGLALPVLRRLTGRAHAAALPELALYGPPAGPSVTLAHAAASGALSHLADKVSFKVWRNPDEMRAGITSGTMQAVVLPVQAAANLYNRGLGVRLLNVMTTGLLYVISTDTGVSDFPGLKGKRLAVPFRNDTPDLILARLLTHYGLVAGTDIQVETTGSPVEAVQLLMAGRVDAVLAPEPAVSAAVITAKAAGKTVARVIGYLTQVGMVAKKGKTLYLRDRAGIEEYIRTLAFASSSGQAASR